VNEKTHQDFKVQTDNHVETLYKQSEERKNAINAVDVKNNDRCTEWTEKMPSELVQELIPGVTEEDLTDDTGADTIEIDVEKNPNSKQARMWTLYQLHRLF